MEVKDETRVHISSCVKRRCTVQTGGEAEGVETTHRCTMAAEVITGRLQQQHYSEAIIHTHTHTHTHTHIKYFTGNYGKAVNVNLSHYIAQTHTHPHPHPHTVCVGAV